MASNSFAAPAGDDKPVVPQSQRRPSSPVYSSRDSIQDKPRDANPIASQMDKTKPDNMRDIEYAVPGDRPLSSIVNKTPEQAAKAQRKSQFYADMFAVREPSNTVKERVTRDSVVMAEVKTNVIVQDEYSFLTSFSTFLSTRYGRPESSIMISLSHSACMLLGGSFDPAYLVTISAVPTLLKSTLNKRNAALVQNFFADELSVPAERGVLKFLPVPEENLATNGVTVLAELEKEKVSSPTEAGFGAIGRRMTISKRKSQLPAKLPTPPMSPTDPLPPTPGSEGRPKSYHTPKPSDGDIDITKVPVPEIPLASPMDIKADKMKRMSKRKSLLQMLGGK